MGVKCRLVLVPEKKTVEYEGPVSATYEEALLSHGMIPDTVLILFNGESLPQDKRIEEDEVEIFSTGSRG